MRVPGLEETGAARDTQSKGRKEHSKAVSALQGLPLGQTPGSARVQRELGSTWFPCWGPAQPMGTPGRPHSGLQECVDFSDHRPLQWPCSGSQGGTEARALKRQASTLGAGWHGSTVGPLAAVLPASLTSGDSDPKARIPHGTSQAWVDGKEPGTKETSTAVFLSPLPTYQVYLGFVFSLNRR